MARHDPEDKGTENLIATQEISNENPSATPSIANRWQGNPFKTQNRSIIFVCCLVLLPMIGFTVVIIWMIWAHKIEPSACPYPELCMSPEQLNQTHLGSGDYIVDFPAARLVFIASWSSTLSTAFIGCIMAIYGYIAASQLLRLSDADWHEQPHPSPYQVTLLIRILNADLLVLWDLGFAGIKDALWDRTRSDKKKSRMPGLLWSTMVVFLFSILCSFSIQLADTYLHIATKAIDLTQAQPAIAASYPYSRGLTGWCLDRPKTSQGYGNNINFWSCAIDVAVDHQPTVWNTQAMNAMEMKVSLRDDYLDWQGEDGTHMSILGPRTVAKDTDYLASSFGVSTQCRAIVNTTCDVSNSTEKYSGYDIQDFNCTKERSGIDAAGSILPFTGQMHFMDYHRFLKEPSPFNSEFNVVSNESIAAAAALSTEDGQTVFRNPWNSLSFPELALRTETEGFMYHNKTRPYLWKALDREVVNMLLHCNSSVWDVNYRVVNRAVTVLNRVLSNSSTTGVSSMTMSPYYKFGYRWTINAHAEATLYPDHPDAYIESFSKTLSEKFLTPFAGVSEPRPAIHVQTRALQVVTRVPKTAIWTLCATNMLFALFAFVMAIFALMAASVDVHQVQTRLSISGLAAQLFEQTQANHQVARTAQLFGKNTEEKPGEIKAVRIQRTETGGTLFMLRGT
ncbi:hypothetical protein EJ02DRAFT_495830 [Clathrospora elynae]|uniref:Uncharacterized protein n=1 Tax=Clathrospora elynae TaxID=706981 RepID=A0A6A5SK52_9PLEO|nr:hypothetical protein EJ02DRAFT_495830 [Clathrospora elynae]